MLVLAMEFSRSHRVPEPRPGAAEGTADAPGHQWRPGAGALPHNGTEEVRHSVAGVQARPRSRACPLAAALEAE